MTGYPGKEFNPETGKRPIVFSFSKDIALSRRKILLPCGQCIGCRIDKAKAWTIRCTHEAQMHEGGSSFITLTYRDADLPDDYSVSVKVWQKFMKNFRDAVWPTKVRFYMGAENGDKKGRPHYHAIIYNYSFPDKKFCRYSKSMQKYPLYRSEFLEKIWKFGDCYVGTVTSQSAGYVARYAMKKQNGPEAEEHYRWQHPITKKIVRITPEFSLQSRRPGIGATWFAKYHASVFPHDYVISGPACRKERSPVYYDKLEERRNPKGFKKVKRARVKRASSAEQKANSTPERLKVREEVLRRRIERLKRDL